MCYYFTNCFYSYVPQIITSSNLKFQAPCPYLTAWPHSTTSSYWRGNCMFQPNSTARAIETSPMLITAWLHPPGIYTISPGSCTNSMILLKLISLSFIFLYHSNIFVSVLPLHKAEGGHKNHFLAPETKKLNASECM